MNNFFNYDRFSLLVRRQWTENKLILLMSIVIYASITAVFYAINMDIDNGRYIKKGVQTSMFIIGLFGGGTLFANYIFKDFSNNIQTMSFLMTPASHFEKLCTGLFYALIAFPIALAFVFGMVDFSFVNFSGNPENEVLFTTILKDYLDYKFLVYIWISLQVFILLGTIYFGRMSYIKTLFTGFIIIVAFGLVEYLLFKIIIGSDQQHDRYINLSSENKKELSASFNFLFEASKFSFYYLLSPFLAVITYFKLKEKEV